MSTLSKILVVILVVLAIAHSGVLLAYLSQQQPWKTLAQGLQSDLDNLRTQRASERQANGLNIGEIECLGTELPQELPDGDKPLAHILAGVLDDLGKLYQTLDKNYGDAGWVAYRFAEILPISPEQKQSCLETEDPLQRLQMMHELLSSVRGTDLPAITG